MFAATIALSMAATSFGTIHTLQSSDLPVSIGTSYNNDTIRIAGTRIVTSGTAITVDAGVRNVLFDFGTDTLEFGTAGGNNAYGMRFAGGVGDPYQIKDCTISGGHVLRRVGSGIASGSDNKGIY
ncbi:MAG: hypothetical protein V3T31_04210, partial [candidate division Zixibacteria bacterium]